MGFGVKVGATVGIAVGFGVGPVGLREGTVLGLLDSVREPGLGLGAAVEDDVGLAVGFEVRPIVGLAVGTVAAVDHMKTGMATSAT